MADWRKILAPASKTGLAASAYVRSSTWLGTCPTSSLDLAALETGRPFLVQPSGGSVARGRGEFFPLDPVGPLPRLMKLIMHSYCQVPWNAHDGTDTMPRTCCFHLGVWVRVSSAPHWPKPIIAGWHWLNAASLAAGRKFSHRRLLRLPAPCAACSVPLHWAVTTTPSFRAAPTKGVR